MSFADAAMSRRSALAAAMKKFLRVTVDQTTDFLGTASSCGLIANALR
jgi:hypothetical protein